MEPFGTKEEERKRKREKGRDWRLKAPESRRCAL
jgi:hypothetical protein